MSPVPHQPNGIVPGRRSAAYLRLCGLNPVVAERLSLPTVDETIERLEAWAATLVPPREGESPSHHRLRARAQLLFSAAPARWPRHFLRPEPPPELVGAVQAATLQPLRPLRQTSMTPEPLDLGPVSEVADETWKTFDKWPVLRGVTVWLLFLLLLATVFYVVRF